MNELELQDIIEEYETTDIVEAVTLCCMGAFITHIKVAGKNKNQGVFCFDGINRATLEDIQFSRARIEPYTYQNQLKRITGMVKTVTGQK